MKLLIGIISIITLTFSPLESETEVLKPAESIDINAEILINQELTFDGYEGEYYFFTDTDFQAVVLKCEKELPVDLINGNFEGKKFRVSYKAAQRTADSSSEGTIEAVAPADKK
ncbi:hypothetical protein [Leeuwenhoekiella nanhaiensis]|uniref:Uncharacterized protein n=1 Tax=Leeuwenhoekiella nanhaiensis TaxID=1655491 RepID=A0A2G1VRJ0_9FLAO|nr:hypothetical protein [Leeuwenhoekiella nanhaiensis]PHQ29386.1 hypothetical protein CJ305_10625 [Leeuwenhoekiella nanhaiensis]